MAPRIFLTADWLDLLLLNYEVDTALLAPHVPRGTVLDTRSARAFVSVVGFRFARTAVLGIPAVFHRGFAEVNLRTYVVRELATERRRGVVFIRELVGRPLVALLARATYNEPYRVAWMRHTIYRSRAGFERLRYEWRLSRGWGSVEAETDGASYAYDGDSEEEFFTQRDWGYTRQRDGATIEYRVDHAPWRVWRVRRATLDGDLSATYGPGFASALSGPFHSAIVAAGSSVALHRGVRL